MPDASHTRTLQLLHRIAMPLDRLLQPADRRAGCSAAQLSALSAVRYFEATTLSGLAAHEKISLPTASRLADGLVRQGFLSRVPADSDRRAVTLAVTAKGMAAIETACAARTAALRHLLEPRLSAAEWDALQAAVPLLTRVLGVGGDAEAGTRQFKGLDRVSDSVKS